MREKKTNKSCLTFLLLSLLIFSCGGGKEVKSFAEIYIEPMISGWEVVIDKSLTAIGNTKPYCYKIKNRGVGKVLEIQDLKWDYKIKNPEKETVEGPSLRLEHKLNFPYLIAPLGEGKTLGFPEWGDFCVYFKRYNDEFERVAYLYIPNNSKDDAVKHLKITFITKETKPVLECSPKVVDFKQVIANETPVKEVICLNNGGSDLIINKFTIGGSKYYSIIIRDVEYKIDEGSQKEYKLDEPLIIQPGKKAEIKVKFSPLTGDPAKGYMILYSNDPDQPSGTKIDFQANTTGPCIDIEPKPPIDFGGKKKGTTVGIDVTIISCGDHPLHIYSLKIIKEKSAKDFNIDYSSLPNGGIEPTKDNPLKIGINESVKFKLTYSCDMEGENDEGYISIENNTFNANLEVKVMGKCVKYECPEAKIVIKEGENVIPQTNLHLYGDQSVPSSGVIEKWFWDVVQPPGSKSVFQPNKFFPNPTFEVNVAGDYKFILDVQDSSGKKASDPDCGLVDTKIVKVMPDQAIHVELLWDTPNDPNQYDEGPEAGADLDLHFLHPYASGPDLDGDGKPDGWFDIPYDCFWFNPRPEWASVDPNIGDNPSLDRDDTDGAGPENINLDQAENGMIYRVGVHYWDDHGYGPSEATVRIYIWKILAFEAKVKMIELDMCEIATIEWPSGKVSAVQDEFGNFKCTHNYVNPGFMEIVNQ